MSITAERLRQIAAVEAKITDKMRWICKKKAELEEKQAMVDSLSTSLKDIMLHTSSLAARNRGYDEPESVH